MNEKELLERAARRFSPASDSLEGFHRRRRRAEMRRRFGIIVLSLVVAAAGIGWLFYAFLGHSGSTPEQSPGASVIDSGNVSQLGLAWSASFPDSFHWSNSSGEGSSTFVSNPVVAGGMVVVVSSDGLYAFPQSCGEHGATCVPRWTAHLASPSLLAPLASEGEVFVAYGTGRAQYAGTVSAYPLDCQRACEPDWTSSLGHVLVTGMALSQTGTLEVAVLPSPCGASNCSGNSSAPTVPRGYLATLPQACSDPCQPISQVPIPTPAYYGGPVIGQGGTFVSSREQITFVPDSCTRTSCETSLPVSLTPPFFSRGVIAGPSGNEEMLVSSNPKGIEAFPADCSGSGCVSLWVMPDDFWGLSGFAQPTGAIVQSGRQPFLISPVTTAPPTAATLSNMGVSRIDLGCVLQNLATPCPTFDTALTGVGRLISSTRDVLFTSNPDLRAYSLGCVTKQAGCPPLWTGMTGGLGALSTVASSGDSVYVSYTGDTGKLYAFDLASGPMQGPIAVSPSPSTGQVGVRTPLLVFAGLAIALVAVVWFRRRSQRTSSGRE